MNSRLKYSVYGFLLGLGFPAAALSFDVYQRGLPFRFESVLMLHQGAAVYWMVDTAPLVLMFVFGLIGAREDRLDVLSKDLHHRVHEATAPILNDKKFFETLVDSNPLATVVLDAEGRILRINAAFERMFQYESADVIGAELDPLITDEATRQNALNLTNRVITGERVRTSYIRLRKDGRAIHVNIYAVPVVVGEDRAGALAIYEDDTERIHIQDQLVNLLEETDKLASRDPLTGLYNRRAMAGLAEAEISASLREALPICLMLIDIDSFKSVNDRYGHEVGDQAIQLVAAKIEADKREKDILGRWGGDEFILVLPDTTPIDGEKVGARFNDLIRRAELSVADGLRIGLSLSIGVCGWDPAAGLPISGDRLFHHADEALLAAKDQGRNRTVCLPLS